MKEIPKGKEITDCITKHMDRRFLNSLDFVGNGTIPLTIDRIELVDMIKYDNGNTEANAKLCYFKETVKPLVLKSVHIRAIVMATKSSVASEWKGWTIGFTAEEGRYFGKDQFAVRVDQKFKATKGK